LERADGMIEKSVNKTYETHFAPDTGYALRVSTKVVEGERKRNALRMRLLV
jgi:hypothetical protein